MRKLAVIVVAALFFLSSAACVFAQSKGKKAVFIIPPTEFEEEEFSRPFAALFQNGVSVSVASTVEKEALGLNGVKARVDLLLSELNVEDFDAVVVVGGPGTAQLMDDPLVHKILQDAVKKRKIVAGICMGPLVLAKAGVLKGKRAAIFPNLEQPLRQSGAKYSTKSVERDGRIITASRPEYGTDFGLEIVRALQ